MFPSSILIGPGADYSVVDRYQGRDENVKWDLDKMLGYIVSEIVLYDATVKSHKIG